MEAWGITIVYFIGAILTAGVVQGLDPDTDGSWATIVAVLWPVSILAYVGLVIGRALRRSARREDG